MSNLTPICFYHSITIVFLDDNASFLDAIQLDMSPQGGDRFRFFTNEHEAVETILSHQENLTGSVLNILDKNEIDLASDRKLPL